MSGGSSPMASTRSTAISNTARQGGLHLRGPTLAIFFAHHASGLLRLGCGIKYARVSLEAIGLPDAASQRR